MSWAIWITGPPASGKTAIAHAVTESLHRLGEPVMRLELDALRKTLTPSPTYSDAEREIVYRTLVYLARLLTACGLPVIIDATAHRRAWRDLARASIPDFVEVQLDCPLEVRRERERSRQPGYAPKDIYATAERAGATVPGVNVPYEEALAPELRIDTSAERVDAAAARIVTLAVELARCVRARRKPAEAGWAIWITGLPGSGKSTLAYSVAERLQAQDVHAVVLDLVDLREFVLGGRPAHVPENEIVHRALVCVAQVLTDAGIAVVIDATAPRRAWRQLAREAIAHFAEVQLSCPAHVCTDRERAVRWNLVLCAAAPARRPATGDPDIVLDYEYSPRPDLIVDTGTQSPTSAAEQILRLVEQVRRKAIAAKK